MPATSRDAAMARWLLAPGGMGFFSSIKNKLTGLTDADNHFFADEGQQQATAQTVAQQVAVRMQSATIKLRDDGDELHVTGTYRGRAARVVLDIKFGKVTSEIKLLASDRTYFRLSHDLTPAEVYAASRKDRDQWDDNDDDLKNYVSRHVCYSGDREELAERKRLWDSLPQDLQAALVAMAEQWNGSFSLSNGTVEISPWEGVLGRRDAIPVIQSHLELAARAAEVLEARLGQLR
jgi:hypothetical protein